MRRSKTDGLTIEQAIIAQACDDYRRAIRNDDKRMLLDVMQFFKSGYFRLMTNTDYTYLTAKMDKEWEDGQRLIAAGNKIDCIELRKKYKFVCPICGGRAVTRETVNKKGTHFRGYSCKDCKISEQRVMVKMGAK